MVKLSCTSVEVSLYTGEILIEHSSYFRAIASPEGDVLSICLFQKAP
jgi:hypothetical protein